jgi:hypothetical protein
MRSLFLASQGEDGIADALPAIAKQQASSRSGRSSVSQSMGEIPPRAVPH